MKVGDIISVKIKAATMSYHAIPKIKHCRVYQIYKTFAVLDTGKYKFCAYISDIKNKAVVSV